jgi:putative membrane protein
MPFAYIVHLRSFLVIWLMALPFTMVQYLGWAAIGACALVAYSLLGLETIGVEVEQPFGRDYCDLPIDQLCDTLTANLLEMLKRHNTAMAARGGVISRLAERGGVGGRPPVSAKLRL